MGLRHIGLWLSATAALVIVGLVSQAWAAEDVLPTDCAAAATAATTLTSAATVAKADATATVELVAEAKAVVEGRAEAAATALALVQVSARIDSIGTCVVGEASSAAEAVGVAYADAAAESKAASAAISKAWGTLSIFVFAYSEASAYACKCPGEVGEALSIASTAASEVEVSALQWQTIVVEIEEKLEDIVAALDEVIEIAEAEAPEQCRTCEKLAQKMAEDVLVS